MNLANHGLMPLKLGKVSFFGETQVTEVTKAFTEEAARSTSVYWMLLIPIVLGIFVWILSRWYVAPTVAQGNAEGLVEELCKAHQLSAKASEFLLRVSRAAESPHPAALFLSKRHFDETVAAAHHRLQWSKQQQTMLQQVRRTLFSDG